MLFALIFSCFVSATSKRNSKEIKEELLRQYLSNKDKLRTPMNLGKSKLILQNIKKNDVLGFNFAKDIVQHGDGDDDDDDDDNDEKSSFKEMLQKFLEFAKTTTGIIALSCSGAALIIIIVLIVFCCKKCGHCKCCCPCFNRTTPPGAEQYGQVILNNDDDIDYGLESI